MAEITGEFRKKVGDKRASLVRVQLEEPILGGEEGLKYKGSAHVRRGARERLAGNVFIKKLVWNIPAETVMKKYHWLKKRHFPVAPMMRYDKKTNTILMTEMSVGGKNIVVDRHRTLVTYGIKPEQIVNWEEIKNEVEEIGTMAHDKGRGLEIDEDNYMITLGRAENGYRGKVWLIDVGYGMNFLSDLAPVFRGDVGLENNKSNARIFIQAIQKSPEVGSEGLEPEEFK